MLNSVSFVQDDPVGRVGVRPNLFKLMVGRGHAEFSGKAQQVNLRTRPQCNERFTSLLCQYKSSLRLLVIISAVTFNLVVLCQVFKYLVRPQPLFPPT